MTFSTIPTDERNRSEVPLGLDSHEVAPEFVRVWRHGGVARGVPSLKGLGRVASAFDTEDEAWEYRGRFAHCFTRISGPPTETTLAERFEKCKQENRRAVVLLNGKGEILKVYPV